MAVGIVAALIVYFGWLYFPLRHYLDYEALLEPSTAKWWALAALAVLYVAALSVQPVNPFEIWLNQDLSSRHLGQRLIYRGAITAWAAYGLPHWAVAIILYPRVVRDLAVSLSKRAPELTDVYSAFGWGLLAFSYIVFLTLVIIA